MLMQNGLRYRITLCVEGTALEVEGCWEVEMEAETQY